ncbi:MAG: carboxypeptidase regulatory-like domain-containing protein [Planctomycetaceae bacterium]
MTTGQLMIFNPVAVFTMALSALFVLPFAAAEDWGTLKGRISVVGTVPPPDAIDVTRDADVCGKPGLADESVLVNPDNQGLRNAVIWLTSKAEVPVHPSYSDPMPVRFDNHDCRFVPRISTLRTGQILQCTNSDPVAHNVAVYARRNQPFSIVVPQDKPLERSFAREEQLPIRVDCSIHAWMRAWLVITDHPYAAVTDADGRFEIPNLPQGKWQFRFWHERPGYITALTTPEGPVELARGIQEIDISGPEIDLGELKLDAAVLLPEKK